MPVTVGRVSPAGQPTVATFSGSNHQRWASSGRRKPCPVCGRDTDDKCRWNDSTINCHQGDSFAPPVLRIGEVLQIEGQPWAVVNLSGGFSGLATVFKPHLPREAWKQNRQRPIRRKVDLKPQAMELFATARRDTQLCYGMPELQRLTLVELEKELAHAKRTASNLKAVRPPLLKARREAPEMGRFLNAVSLWQKQVGYQLQDIERFFRLELGTPTTAQIQALDLEVA